MKISCILASYNRPVFVRQALRSIRDQTHQDFELIVVDNSTKMNFLEILRDPEFQSLLTRTVVISQRVSTEQRSKVNMLGVAINAGLARATGDLVCFLADDDAYFSTWFEKASAYFEKAPASVSVGFGILKYCHDELDFAEHGEIRFWDEIIKDPGGRLDHNQIVHRRFDPIQKWPENLGTESNADFWYFQQLANQYDFHPINAFAAVKRLHSKNLQNHVSLYQSGKMDDLRE
jgi:glycosyltransferase involved in cell wall biosynthesis